MTIRTIVFKDVRKIFKDKKILVTILMMPMVIMTILGFSLNSMFQGSDSGINQFQVGVVYQYDVEAERAKAIKDLAVFMGQEGAQQVIDSFQPNDILINDFLKSESIEKMMLNKEYADLDAAKTALASKEIAAIIVVPKDFVYQTYINFTGLGKSKYSFEIIKSESNSFQGLIAEQVMKGFANGLNQSIYSTQTVTSILAKDMGIEAALKMAQVVMDQNENNSELAITYNEKAVEKEKMLSGFQYYAAAIMAMFLFYGASITIRMMLEEKNEMTMQRLIVSGVSFNKVILANYFTSMSIVAIQSVIMIGYSSVALKVQWGNPLQVFIIILISSFAVAGLATTIGLLTYFSGKFGIANIYEFVFINGMALIGGSFLPLTVMPKAIQDLAVISINGNCIRMYTGIMLGRTVMEYQKEMIAMLIMGFGFGILSFVIKQMNKAVI